MNRNKVQKEILNSIEPGKNARLIVAQRVGKTKIIISLIKRDKPNSILWVTPSKILANGEIQKEFKKWNAKRYLKKLKTSTYASLNKVVGYFDLIILDEEQHITVNNAANLLNKKLTCSVLISMTGTKTQHDHKNTIFKKLNLNIVKNINIDSAVDMNILAKYKIYNILVPMTNNIDFKNGKTYKEKVWYDILSKRVNRAIVSGNNKNIKYAILNRRRFIINSTSKYIAAEKLISKLEGRKIIFAGSIKQADKICPYNFHSQTSHQDLIKFQNNEIDCISMVNSGGTGFTYNNLEHLILIQSDSDKNGSTLQKLARILLKQKKDYKAKIWILTLLGTQDEKWTNNVLSKFKSENIIKLHSDNINNKKLLDYVQ